MIIVKNNVVVIVMVKYSIQTGFVFLLNVFTVTTVIVTVVLLLQ